MFGELQGTNKEGAKMKRRLMIPCVVLAFVLPCMSGTFAEEVFVQEELSLDALGMEVGAEASTCQEPCVVDYYVFAIAPGPNWSKVQPGESNEYNVPIPSKDWLTDQHGTLSMWIRDVEVAKTEMEWYKHHLEAFPVWSMWLPVTCEGCTAHIDNHLLPIGSTMLQAGNIAMLKFRNDSGTYGSEYKDVDLVFPYCKCPDDPCTGGAVAEASTGSAPKARNISALVGFLCMLLLPMAFVFLTRRILIKRTR